MEVSVKRLAIALDEAREVGGTLTDHVFEGLRSDILKCNFLPGAKLKQEVLRAKYNASGSSIREALSKLTSIGLVVAETRRGFTVAQMSAKDLLDLTKTRVWVEGLALRTAIAKGGRDWEAGILAAEHMLGDDRQRFLTKYGSTPEEEQRRYYHLRFHDALIAGCELTSLMTYRETLTALSERYRFLSSLVPANRNVRAEHRALVKAALARDQEKAVLLIGVHFWSTAALVLSGTRDFKGNVADTVEQMWAETCQGMGVAGKSYAAAKKLMQS